MTDTISETAKAKAEELLAEGIGAGVVDAVTALTTLARVLQEHSDIVKGLAASHHGCCPEAWEARLQSMILPDDEPDEVDEISRDLLQRIAHGDSEHREWLKRELSRHLRIVAAGYEIRRKDG